jgi:hypothetical protein
MNYAIDDVFFLVPSTQNDGDAVESVSVKSVLFDRVEEVNINAEEPFPFKKREPVQKTLAQRNADSLEHDTRPWVR